MFSKFYVVLILDICVCLALKPTLLSPGLDSNHEVLLYELDPLEVHCRGYNDLILLYPKNLKTKIPSSRAEIIEHKEGPTKAKILKRYDSVYGDTGWYGCVDTTDLNHLLRDLENIYMTPYNYNESDVQWIYIYVQAPSSDFIQPKAGNLRYDNSDETVEYSVNPGETVVFPCLPTSPSVTITLYKNMNEIELNDRITYDPKRGFAIKNATPEDGGLYFCSTDQSSLWFTLTVKEGNYVRRPILRSYYANYGNETEVKMTCGVEIDKDIMYELYWKSPQKNDRISAITRTWNYSDENSFSLVTDHELTVENFSHEDQGIYECQFYEDSELRSDFINVALEDGIVKFEYPVPANDEAFDDENNSSANDFSTSSSEELNDAPDESKSFSTKNLEDSIFEKMKPLIEKVVHDEVEKYVKEYLEAQVSGLELLKDKIKNSLIYALEQF